MEKEIRCPQCVEKTRQNKHEKSKSYRNGRTLFIHREKKRIYVIALVSRDKCQIVGYDIVFDKSRKGKCKVNVINKGREKQMRIGIRGIKFSRSEIVKGTNKDFKNIFHSINRPKETFRSTS